MSGRYDDVILSYYDTILYQADVDLLSGPHWLNDAIISFYLEYLEKEKYSGTNILLISPAVTQCLKASPLAELSIFLDPLQTLEKDFIFMPLNDCEDLRSPGGTHWSLLVYSKPENTFYHLDSSNESNDRQARSLSFKLSGYLKLNKSYYFKSLDSLQQDNMYDCGIYMLCNIENLAEYVLRNKRIEGAKLIKRSNVVTKRFFISELINSLAQR
ncbi:sentrin-specific protease 8-like [Lycorma delicatula]|uniref:sentrin-specific protease 8-like n=1 Tax=Lycorma delicatula TaxID=130591 RepID=UPI003F5190EE